MDSVFENNVLLTQTERLMMSGRPKEPKYARNKNILVIGGSGSGKTRFFVKPSAPVRAVYLEQVVGKSIKRHCAATYHSPSYPKRETGGRP